MLSLISLDNISYIDIYLIALSNHTSFYTPFFISGNASRWKQLFHWIKHCEWRLVMCIFNVYKLKANYSTVPRFSSTILKSVFALNSCFLMKAKLILSAPRCIKSTYINIAFIFNVHGFKAKMMQVPNLPIALKLVLLSILILHFCWWYSMTKVCFVLFSYAL